MRGYIREQRTICGAQYMEVDIYPVSSDEHRRTARGRKQRESSTALKNCNARQARRYLNQLVATNFTPGAAWLVHLTYADEYLPSCPEDAQRDVTNFLKKINRRLKTLGAPKCKYISVCEWQDEDPAAGRKEVRYHHHMILECGLTIGEIKDCWRKGAGQWSEALGLIKADRAEFSNGALEAYCEYITKYANRARRWRQSKGLQRPEKPRPNDTRYTQRKLNEAATLRIDDREYWESLYGVRKLRGGRVALYRFVSAEALWNEATAQWHVTVKLWADPRRQPKRARP